MSEPMHPCVLCGNEDSETANGCDLCFGCGRMPERLERIAEIIEAVDQRCAAVDGPVSPMLQEMRQSEISEIYKLATESRKLEGS